MIRSMLQLGVARDWGHVGVRLFDAVGFREAVEEVLLVTGRYEQRRCVLRASLVMTFIVGLFLYRHLGMPGVFREVLGWYRRRYQRRGLRLVTDEAPLKARERMGVLPVALLFSWLASDIEVRPTFHGLRVYGIDGLHMSVADTKANEATFGRCNASHGSPAAFPQLLAVTLVATETHQVRDVIFDRCDAAERPACERFLEQLGSGDLILLDRGFHAVWLFQRCLERGVKFLCRAPTRHAVKVLRKLGPGDYLVEISGRVPIAPEERRVPGQRYKRVRLVLRMLEYRVGRRARVRLLTNLLDAQEITGPQLARLYHDRWECELVNDELKTHLASVARGSVNLTFRSKTPQGVVQEAYALFIAYNLVRRLMAEAADRAQIPACELSFVGCLQVIRIYVGWLQYALDARTLRSVERAFWSEMAACRMTRSRRPRLCPRAVRLKIIRYARKRPRHRERRLDASAEIRLVNRYSSVQEAA